MQNVLLKTAVKAGLLFLIVLFKPPSAQARAMDPHKVLGVENCAECHEKESEVWNETKHATGLKAISRHKDSKTLKKLLGLKRIKREQSCVRCHFTNAYVTKKRKLPGAKPLKPKLKTIDAVSCESCHGQAKTWGPIHGDYGGKKITKQMETEEHRRQRLEKLKNSNLVGHNNLYDMTKRCFACHITDDEKIVNTKAHPALTKDFEMVAWSQGHMRHNLWFSDGKSNAEAPLHKRRLYYILGKTVALEMSLRALAKSQSEGFYQDTMKAQIEQDVQALEKIVELGGPAEITPLLKSADLQEWAQRAGETARQIEANYDGKTLAAIDSLLPQQSNYKQLEK